METDLHASCWAEAREQGQQVLADTEATLTRAKQEHARLRSHRFVWLHRLSWSVIPLAFILPALWGKYIYSEQWQIMNHEVQVCFEEAFVEENDLRHTRSLDVNHLRGTRKSFITGMTVSIAARKKRKKIGKRPMKTTVLYMFLLLRLPSMEFMYPASRWT